MTNAPPSAPRQRQVEPLKLQSCLQDIRLVVLFLQITDQPDPIVADRKRRLTAPIDTRDRSPIEPYPIELSITSH